MIRSKGAKLALLVGGPVLLVGCGEGGQEELERMVTTTTVAPRFVSALDQKFSPTPLEVNIGFEVVWLNKDAERHTVTSGPREAPDGKFDVELPVLGTNFNFKFEAAGTYPYFCRLHPEMSGEIVVV